jgi:hypothetical protein
MVSSVIQLGLKQGELTVVLLGANIRGSTICRAGPAMTAALFVVGRTGTGRRCGGCCRCRLGGGGGARLGSDGGARLGSGAGLRTITSVSCTRSRLTESAVIEYNRTTGIDLKM